MSENGQRNAAKKKPVPLRRTKTETLAQSSSIARDRIVLLKRASRKSENPKSGDSDSNNNETGERQHEKTQTGIFEDTGRKQTKSECLEEAEALGMVPKENATSEGSEMHRRDMTIVVKESNKSDSELYQCEKNATQGNSEEKKPVPLRRSKTEKLAQRNSMVLDRIALFDKASINYNWSKSENPKRCRSDSNNDEVDGRRQQVITPIGKCEETEKKQRRSECPAEGIQNHHTGEEKEEIAACATIDNGVTSEEQGAVVGDLEVSNANPPETTTDREKGEKENQTQEEADCCYIDFVEACNRNGNKEIAKAISLNSSEVDDDNQDDGYENQCDYYREAYFDENPNPNIEKTSSLNSSDVQAPGKLTASLSLPPSPSETKNKIDYIIEELIITEQKYVEDLWKIKKDYMAYLSDELDDPTIIGKQCYLFGNIEEILASSEEFLAALRGCGGNYELITETFVANANMFELYSNYSKNKLRADYYHKYFKTLINKRQNELGERLDLASYLMSPIKRLGMYVLLLENMQKELRRQDVVSENLDSAIAIVKGAMKRGNDSVAVNSIKNCPISLIEQAGSFIMREKFAILKPRKFESIVFLFEEIVVFTEVLPSSIYYFSYVEHIFLKDLTIVTFEQEALMFHLVDYIKCKKHENRELNTHVLEARSLKVKQTFTSQIEMRLWEQLHEVKEKVNEMHSKESKRYSTQEINGEEKDQTSNSVKEKTEKKAGDKIGQSTFYV